MNIIFIFVFIINIINKYMITNPDLAKFISELCMDLGINTAHDYDGVESDTDVEIYKKSIVRNISNMKKEIKDLKSKIK